MEYSGLKGDELHTVTLGISGDRKSWQGLIGLALTDSQKCKSAKSRKKLHTGHFVKNQNR